MPSDFRRSNCFASFQEDPTLSLEQWRSVGIETLTWGSDYPHFESTYPRSLETVRELMAGLSEDEQQRVAYANTKRIFGFEV